MLVSENEVNRWKAGYLLRLRWDGPLVSKSLVTLCRLSYLDPDWVRPHFVPC